MARRPGAVIVTGSASGIGRATARLLASEGIPLVLQDLSIAGRRLAGLLERRGSQAVFVRGDVADEAHAAEVVREAIAAFGAIDGLVNNAGVVGRARLEDLRLADWRRTLAVNLTGPMLFCRACLPVMKARRRGAIVNVASLAGQSGGILVGADYAASKGGLIALTKAVAREAAPWGIRCNAVAPGAARTAATRPWGEETLRALAEGVPLGRLGRPEDAARAIAFLLSDRAAYITGATLDVNGGLLMR